MKFLWWGCDHNWKIVKKRFIPPVKDDIDITAWGLDAEDIVEKMVSGYTRRTWKCQKCEKIITDEVIGDDT